MKGNLIMTPENYLAFERNIAMLDSSLKEMRRMVYDMMPEALVTFGLDKALKDFCKNIDQDGIVSVNYRSIGVDNAIFDGSTTITIYRIVQELLNNAIKHTGATSVIVLLRKTGSRLSITVKDDGKGFDKKTLNETRGIGLANIQSRIGYLNGKLDIHSVEEKGTSVYIEIII